MAAAELQSRLASLGTRLYGIAVLGEPVGKLPCPAVLDALSSRLAALLSADSFPVHLPSVDLGDPALSRALIVVALAPLIWNIIARFEFHTRAISRVVGRYPGAYALALWIFSFSVYRDLAFLAALESQPRVPQLAEPLPVAVASAAYVLGLVLVCTSMLRLGVTGTYLGDYFGILMAAKVESFPYSMFRDPMYDGATLCFLGKSILYVARMPYLLSPISSNLLMFGQSLG